MSITPSGIARRQSASSTGTGTSLAQYFEENAAPW
jgi:hypothetical protein